MNELLVNFFGSRMLFPVLIFLSAAMMLALAVYFLKVTPENVAKMEKLPRWKVPGIILGTFVVAWCIPHAMPILPDSLHKLLFPVMAALVLASWFVLDHLFGRALGGYLILTAHLFLRETFAYEAISNPVFPVLCFLYGTFGIFLCGMPYRLRDIVRLELNPKYKWIFPGFFAVMFLAFVTMGICYLRVMK